MIRHITIALALFSSPLVAQQCGDPDTPCQIDGGSYHISVPEGVDNPGIFVFVHGSNGHGRNAIRNGGFVARVGNQGYALVSPTGTPDFGDGLDWSVRDGVELEGERDDVAFLGRVIDDAAARFGLDRDRAILTGFSRGGSMVWDVACAAPQTASAYATSAGAFWAPFVDQCHGPVRLHHSHGFSDRTVPFEGRRGTFRGRVFHQGNVMEAIDVWRRTNGCEGRASETVVAEQIWQKVWADCDLGEITLRLWPGGHGLPPDWARTVIDWYETEN